MAPWHVSLLTGILCVLTHVTDLLFTSSEQTGLWTELGKIENNFLKPLHLGLNMSKAHYEAEIKNSQQNSQGWYYADLFSVKVFTFCVCLRICVYTVCA